MGLLRWMTGLSLVAFGLVGCATNPSDTWIDGPGGDLGGDYDYVESPLIVEATLHEGSIGQVRDFDGDVFMTRGFSAPGNTSIDIISENRAEGWAAMSMLYIQGSLDDLTPGAELTYNFDHDGLPEYYDGAELFVSLTGCSGPENGLWEDDIPAETLTVTVLPPLEGANPDARVLHYVGEFPDGGRVEGEVQVELR